MRLYKKIIFLLPKMAIFLTFLVYCKPHEKMKGCSVSVIQSTNSQDGRWVASSLENICEFGFSTTLIVTVEAGPSGQIDRRTKLLGIEVGNKVEYPHITWKSNGILLVLIPDAHFLKIGHRSIPGINVEFRLETEAEDQKVLLKKALQDARD